MATKNVISKTKFSQVTATPPSLAVGEQAYSTVSNSLFIGDSTGSPIKIGGAADVNKLAGIEPGAQVNTVNSVAGKTGNVTLASSDVGLGNVTNESKATMFTNPTFTGTVSGVTAAMVGLGNVDNTSDANKPVSTATQTALNLKADKADPTFTGNVTLGNSTPSDPLHAASKAYVDTMSLGITVKDPARVATTAPIALSGLIEIDGITVIAGDRVLVKDQVDATENGIYAAASGAWTRTTDADNNPGGTNSEVRNGMFVFVEEGTLNKNTQWTLQTTDAVVIGTTELNFSKFSSQTTYLAGTGLTLISSTFAIDSTVLTTGSTNVLFENDTLDGGSF